jgi:hypothetical protein
VTVADLVHAVAVEIEDASALEIDEMAAFRGRGDVQARR